MTSGCVRQTVLSVLVAACLVACRNAPRGSSSGSALDDVLTGSSEAVGVWISSDRKWIAVAGAGRCSELQLLDSEFRRVSAVRGSTRGFAFSESNDVICQFSDSAIRVLTVPDLRELVMVSDLPDSWGVPMRLNSDVISAPSGSGWILTGTPRFKGKADLAFFEKRRFHLLRSLGTKEKGRKSLVDAHGLESVVVGADRSLVLFDTELEATPRRIDIGFDVWHPHRVAGGNGLVAACGDDGELAVVCLEEQEVIFSRVVHPGYRGYVSGGGSAGLFAVVWQLTDDSRKHETIVSVWRFSRNEQKILHQEKFELEGPIEVVHCIALNAVEGYVLVAAGRLFKWSYSR